MIIDPSNPCYSLNRTHYTLCLPLEVYFHRGVTYLFPKTKASFHPPKTRFCLYILLILQNLLIILPYFGFSEVT